MFPKVLRKAPDQAKWEAHLETLFIDDSNQVALHKYYLYLEAYPKNILSAAARPKNFYIG